MLLFLRFQFWRSSSYLCCSCHWRSSCNFGFGWEYWGNSRSRWQHQLLPMSLCRPGCLSATFCTSCSTSTCILPPVCGTSTSILGSTLPSPPPLVDHPGSPKDDNIIATSAKLSPIIRTTSHFYLWILKYHNLSNILD